MTATDLEAVSPEELLALIGRATDGADVTADEIGRILVSKADDGMKRRVLRYIAGVKKRAKKLVGAGEPIAEVLVRPAHRGRVTGFSMACLACGLVAPSLASSKRLAELAGVGHLRTDHDGVGRLDSR